MEDDAMRFLNLIANKAFSFIFTWLLSQRLTDTLCGTKVLRRGDYQRLRLGDPILATLIPLETST